MEATNILMEEHRVIVRVLSCLEKIVSEAEDSGKLNADAANVALDFFRNFADGCHHAKEEDRLFVVMQEKGIPNHGGPIGVMLSEHDHGRHFVQGMSAAVAKAAQGDMAAIEKFTENARDLIALLNDHIYKEDHVLFPTADQILEGEAGDGLLTDFRRIESEAGGHRHRDCLEVVRKLCRQYDVPFLQDSDVTLLRKEFKVD